jgi:hypothetical protein
MPEKQASAAPTPHHDNLPLDRVAAAVDQAVVVEGLSRTLILFGLLLAGASLWPPANVVWAGMFSLFALAGVVLLLPYRLARHRLAANVIGGLIMIFGVLALVESVLTVTPLAQITPFDRMTADFEAAVTVANTRYGTAAWWIARAIAAVLQGLLAIEVIAAVWLLLRLDGDERRLLAQTTRRGVRGALGWLFDLPPSTGRYFRGAGFMLLLVLLGMLLFMVAATNIAGGWMIQSIGALTAVSDCLGEAGLDAACFDFKGQAAAGGMALLAVFSVVILPLLATLLTRFARTRAARSSADRLNQDERPPILFLRSFTDDQVTLAPPRRTPMRYALSGIRPAKPLDTLLLDAFLDRAPPRALGRQAERTGKFRPYGALREYPSNEAWQDRVHGLAKAAAAIVIVFDAEFREGLSWELCTLGSEARLRVKTVFAIRPDVPTTERAAAWRQMGAIAGLRIPDVADLQTLTFDTAGNSRSTSAQRITATTMWLALCQALSRGDA